MSETFNISELSSLAKKLLDKYENGEEFLLGQVHQQIRQAYEKFPEDTVIRQMSAVIEKMAEKNPPSTIINQKQISSIYNDLVRLAENTKFRTVLGHLLFAAPENNKVKNASNIRGDGKAIEEKDLIDPEVKRILSLTFDDDVASKTYNKKLASKGINYVIAELKSIGFNTNMIKIAGGNANKLFYMASFDTIRGPVSVYIPTNVSDGKFILPTTFIDDRGEQELNKETLSSSLERRGGKAELIKGIKNAEIDLPELTIQTKEVPKELSHLTKDFENILLETSSSFGKEAVNMGKKIIANELRAAGFKNAQVRYGSDSLDSVIYFTGINTPQGTVEIEVPLEMKQTLDDKFIPMMPTCFAYNESLNNFTYENLQKFALNAVEYSVSGNSTLYSFMSLSELKEELIKSASKNDYLACEEILNQIGKTFEESNYKNAIADYQYILSVKSKANETQIKNAEIARQSSVLIPAGKGSLYPRLANGQPIKDMVKDEDGNYVKITDLQREKLNPVDESGVLISTSQILFT